MTGFTSETVPDKPELLWTVPTRDSVRGGAVVSGDRVFFGSGDGAIYAVDAASGHTNWVFDTGAPIESTPCVLGDRVFAGNDDGHLVALDTETGSEVWRYKTEDRIVGGVNFFRFPKNGEGRIVVGSYDYHVHCVRAATGELVWKYATSNFVNGTPAIDGRFAYAGGCDGLLHAVDLVSGKPAQVVEIDAYIAGSPAVDGAHAYLGHYGNEVLRVGLDTGQVSWAYEDREFPFFASPALSSDLVLIGGRDKRMHAIRRSTGEPVWQARTKGRIDSSAVIAVDRVVSGSEDGRLYIWDLASGAELWRYDLGDGILSSPAVSGGRIFVGCEDGRLYAFGAPVDPGLTVHGSPSPLAAGAVVSDWPRFLGPDHGMVSRESPLRLAWDRKGPPLVWEREIGEGYASPVVAEDRLIWFHRVGNEEVVECLDPVGGGRYWEVRNETVYRDRYGFNGGPRSSPLISDDSVVTYGVEGILQCIDLESGALRWRRDLNAEYGISQNFFGVGTSPVEFGSRVIINLGAPGGPAVAAFDLRTGDCAWEIEHEWGPSYATPVIAPIHGALKLLVFAGGESRPPSGGLLGIDLETRALEFAFPMRSEKFESVNASSPLVINDRVFVSHSIAGKGALVRASKDGGVEPVWTTHDLGVYWMTPVHKDGYIYGFNGRHESQAELVCLDAATGERMWRWAPKWKETVTAAPDSREFSAHIGRGHLLRAEGRFLCLGETGALLWLDLGPDRREILQRCRLFHAPETFAPPVLRHGLLYVVQTRPSRQGRQPSRLLCYDLREKR